MSDSKTPRQTVGRPRSPIADRAIIDATVRLLRQGGCSNLSVERVAAEAGVGKTTIYRRYKDRYELAAAAALHVTRHPPYEVPEGIDVRTGLVRALAHLNRSAGSTAVLSMLGTLLAEQDQHPDHLHRFWAHVFGPHRNAMLSVFERGANASETGQETQRDVAADSLIGTFLARKLSGARVTSKWMEATVETLLAGIRTSARVGDNDI